jgi:molecular chaperone GrpE (heat shock protein)
MKESYLKVECKAPSDKVEQIYEEMKNLLHKFGVKEIDIRHRVGEVWR